MVIFRSVLVLAFSALLPGLFGGCAATASSGAARLHGPQLKNLGLVDLRGQAQDLGALTSTHRATVLVFWATRCPCVRRYAARVEALRRRYAARQVAMVAIASNADDNTEGLRRHQREVGLRLPLWRDPAGRLAHAVGARSTPTVAVLTRDGQIAFLGWIDNERQPGASGRVAYLEEALDATLHGARPSTPRSPVYGCMITRRLGDVVTCTKPR